MKKFISLLFAVVTVVGLSGCGSSSSGSSSSGGSIDNGENIDNGNTYSDVYLTELNQGYSISGYNSSNENVEIIYCNNEYTYYRDSESFVGTFYIDDDQVEMSDYDNGSYVLIVDSYDDNGEPLMVVNNTYACPSLGRDLTVNNISIVPCN